MVRVGLKSLLPLLEETMNVKVLSIEPAPANETGKFNVVVLIENEQHKFTVNVEKDIIGDRELLTTSL